MKAYGGVVVWIHVIEQVCHMNYAPFFTLKSYEPDKERERERE
jgi:hypothetical protein